MPPPRPSRPKCSDNRYARGQDSFVLPADGKRETGSRNDPARLPARSGPATFGRPISTAKRGLERCRVIRQKTFRPTASVRGMFSNKIQRSALRAKPGLQMRECDTDAAESTG